MSCTLGGSIYKRPPATKFPPPWMAFTAHAHSCKKKFILTPVYHPVLARGGSVHCTNQVLNTCLITPQSILLSLSLSLSYTSLILANFHNKRWVKSFLSRVGPKVPSSKTPKWYAPYLGNPTKTHLWSHSGFSPLPYLPRTKKKKGGLPTVHLRHPIYTFTRPPGIVSDRLQHVPWRGFATTGGWFFLADSCLQYGFFPFSLSFEECN